MAWFRASAATASSIPLTAPLSNPCSPPTRGSASTAGGVCPGLAIAAAHDGAGATALARLLPPARDIGNVHTAAEAIRRERGRGEGSVRAADVIDVLKSINRHLTDSRNYCAAHVVRNVSLRWAALRSAQTGVPRENKRPGQAGERWKGTHIATSVPPASRACYSSWWRVKSRWARSPPVIAAAITG